MKRWLLRICVLLVLGAIVNVAVAWGVATFGRSLPLTILFERLPKYLEITNPKWLFRAPEGWPSSPKVSVTVTGFGVKGYWGMGPVNEQRQWQFQGVRTYGWPCASMHVRREADSTEWWSIQNGLWVPRRFSDGILLPERSVNPMPGERVLPTLPLWPGFAINTVFNAVVLWLLFAGPFVLRRRRRIRRGLCPKCAYDLRGSKDASACPECGAAVRQDSPRSLSHPP